MRSSIIVGRGYAFEMHDNDSEDSLSSLVLLTVRSSGYSCLVFLFHANDGED